MQESIAFQVELDCSQPEAVDRVVDELKEYGFGVLTRIDIHKAFKEKLGMDFRTYSILGACNPPLAHRALSSNPEVGLLLPCNVTVEEREGGGSIVRIVNPKEMMRIGGFASDERIASVSDDAHAGLKKVAEALRASRS